MAAWAGRVNIAMTTMRCRVWLTLDVFRRNPLGGTGGGPRAPANWLQGAEAATKGGTLARTLTTKA